MSARSAALLCLFLLPAGLRAGNVDDKDDAAFSGPGRLLRFDYANDVFTGSDRYYTQGLGLTYFDPALKADPLMRALPALPGGPKNYGLAVRHSGFTPSSIHHEELLVGDRPFAAYLFLSHLLVSRDPELGLTLTAGWDAGIVGQGAGGKWMQTGIHRALGNLLPQGWDHQIRNDFVLDYHARLEKILLAWRAADLGAFIDATAGTLYTSAAVGAKARLGALAQDRKTRYFLFASAEEKVVGYDATLQGGLTNRGSPYTLTDSEIERGVSREELGVVLDFGGFALEARRVFQSREFGNGLAHQWIELSALKRF